LGKTHAALFLRVYGRVRTDAGWQGRSGRLQYRAFADIFKRGAALAPSLYWIADFPTLPHSRMVRPMRTVAPVPCIPGAALTGIRVTFACLALGLDGTWRGTPSGTSGRGSMHHETVDSQFCNPKRAGDLKRS
jgi:hypothetical protein